MKKIWGVLLAAAMMLAMGVCAMAGTFDGYWDFMQEDGTYAYGFPRILVSMDKTWYRNTRVAVGEEGRTASFYHKDSYNAYAEEGMVGGLLFTIGASVNTDFEDLPHFVYLGFDEEEAMNYYASLPTDYQAYMGDDAIRNEYDELWSGVEDVLDSVVIKGSEKFREMIESDDVDQPEFLTSGDYCYSINDGTAVIVKYNGAEEILEVPSEIDGYPVAEIGDEAFRYRKLKSVSVPESVSRIGRQAFAYCDITDALELPENVTIRKDAFSYAVLPSEVIIPAGATVEECAFSYCEVMEKVCIEPGTVLKGRAFDYCDDLLLAVIADGSRLENNAFELCRKLKTVVLCGDVKTEEESFFGCQDAEITQTEAGEYATLKLAALEELVDLTPYEEEPRVLEIRNSPATLDGVTVTLESAVAERDPYTGAFTYILGGTIENNSDEGIMQVVYTFALIDENGEEFRSFSLVYDGEDTALPPQAKADFFRDDIKWGKQSLPAAVEIGISSVETETELPPVHVPQTGEYLYQALGDEKLAKIREEAPVELSFHVDQGGYGRTATFGEGDALDWAVELLCEIKIGEESGEWVTDNYNWIRLKWADGSYTGISLNLSNLEYWAHSTPHTFELEKLGEFWSFCEKYLEEDPYEEVEDA